MTQTKRRPTSRSGAARGLPPITVAKLQECSALLERLVREKTSIFADNANDYRTQWRATSERVLSAQEAASIAGVLAADLEAGERVKLAELVQGSGLRAQDEPTRAEVLLAAGVATAPAFLDATLRVVALVEMPNADLEQHAEDGTLHDEIKTRAADLQRLELRAARSRADAALQHFAASAGYSAGEVVGVIAQMVQRAMSDAITPLASSSLTGSPEPTDGTEDASSTTPPGGTP